MPAASRSFSCWLTYATEVPISSEIKTGEVGVVAIIFSICHLGSVSSVSSSIELFLFGRLADPQIAEFCGRKKKFLRAVLQTHKLRSAGASRKI